MTTSAPINPRQYDTGLSGPDRTLIRDGVVEMLSPSLKQNGGFAALVKGFPFPVKSYVDILSEIDILLEQVNGLSPAYLVAVGDLVGTRTGANGQNKGVFDVDVYSYSDHMQDLVVGRMKSDARAQANLSLDPGLDVMMAIVRMLLTDKPVPGVSRKSDVLRFAGEKHLFTEREASLWVDHFTLEFTLVTNMNRNLTQYMTGLHAKHFPATDGSPADPATDTPTVETLSLTPHP